MTHIVHPYSHRIGIIRDWKSRWFGDKKKYGEFLKADVLLREFLEKKLKDFYVSSIETERNDKSLKIIIKTSRPGMIIGRNGEGSKKLRDDILKFIKKRGLLGAAEIKIDIEEIRSPESDAGVVAAMVREGLEKRMPFRRVVKQILGKVSANRDVKGARIVISGRLGGAEMARKEEAKSGRIPLQTFRADVDFALSRAVLPYGTIGIKVWIYKGEIFE
ncbi:30S ribosomal protein S3 [Candidatus Campbellbacteria bacterium CG11_big_fil_rev_8_21_14_0_20_44_21]|uniref:Small ribosomal subunit protein uS3 n=1 Tax=Candidatus Campbellbacteria bacterium CG22_combo_CG10-13_8_21_14_all_43_18 TaxID=1974530 RepID=A0A2H0DWG6_9BACT|nr:MAG: 30S ribosomal protein S3 [Candidatus Campbellbacteria bacterium CG22_combo_CG10-13_8_21_14_all_43_18]PIR24337.1 MAG: 30S ribosomal protein S3 [Candidatus Campbellbacteria bacterium CG11_big_fil_rev_8_21_14_0_20_44_21]